jgi:hypothetical protein
MLFWLGLAIAFIAGLLSIGFSRETVKARFPLVGDYYLDVAAVILLAFGLVLSAVEHYRSERSFQELTEKTSYRHLTAKQIAAMRPPLSKLKGRSVAFAFRLMDGESSDYTMELIHLFRDAGCVVPEPIKTSVNDLRGYVAITPHGKVDSDITDLLLAVFRAGDIPAKADILSEDSIGVWYDNVVHVVVGRKAPR